ncbi:MAG: hypothetical protein HYU31_17030 [Deltaproteobacteria bacterium]|nr:hypothetical protein [Deltaproteobacteria bacterium]
MAKTLSAVLFLCGLMAGNSNASTICKIEDSLIGIKAIAWNDEDGTAKITDTLNNTLAGRISLKRKHDGGEKVNIYLKYERPYYGDDAAEYMIFPVGNGQFRIIGVTYVIRNNEKYLNASSGNFLATCIKL